MSNGTFFTVVLKSESESLRAEFLMLKPNMVSKILPFEVNIWTSVLNLIREPGLKNDTKQTSVFIQIELNNFTFGWRCYFIYLKDYISYGFLSEFHNIPDYIFKRTFSLNRSIIFFKAKYNTIWAVNVQLCLLCRHVSNISQNVQDEISLHTCKLGPCDSHQLSFSKPILLIN